MQLAMITSLYRSDKHLRAFLRHARRVHRALRRANIHFEHLLIINEPTPTETLLTQDLETPFRIIVVPREPIYASWNRGIRESSAAIVCFWNVDDIRFARAITTGVQSVENGADAVYFPFIYIRYIHILGMKLLGKIKLIMPPPYEPKRFQKEMHAGPHFMISRRALEQNGFFNESFTVAGDFDWWTRFATSTLRAHRLNTISGIFTNDGTTLSGSRSTLHQQENQRILQRL